MDKRKGGYSKKKITQMVEQTMSFIVSVPQIKLCGLRNELYNKFQQVLTMNVTPRKQSANVSNSRTGLYANLIMNSLPALILRAILS